MNIISYFLNCCSKISNCQICNKATSIFEKPFLGLVCNICWVSIAKIDMQCPKCGRAMADHLICGVCLKHPPIYDEIHVKFAYSEPLSILIQNYKYHQKLFWRKYFAKMMLNQIPNLPKADILIPVPMHKARLQERGFNHAWELVKQLSKLTKIKCSNNLVIKLLNTPTQAGTKALARRQQQKNSFQVADNSYQHVIIVDDIITTGSTVSEIAKLLKISGVSRVDVWCLARA